MASNSVSCWIKEGKYPIYYRIRKYIDLLGPVILAEALALDHDPVAHAAGHLVVGDQQVPAALREDGTGGPVSGGEKIFQYRHSENISIRNILNITL